MSGFAGMISLDGATPDRRLLEKMTACLAFRGPDGTHVTAQPGAGFCFTFLRTGPAPQCPSQPCSLDGRVWLLGDVRLDGRDDVRRKLEQHGDTVSTQATDEELVLRAWQRWGEDGITELIGDYAFALWDAEERVLRCWRDLMGARPFFYAQARGWFYFSNTLNAVRCAPGISRELDHHFIGDFLLEGWCPDGSRTAFRQIARLPAGHFLRYSAHALHVIRYTSLPIEEPLWLKREQEYVEQFRDLLEEAVLSRLPRGRAAILMSGGLDSTSVAAFAVESARKHAASLDLQAHTVDYRPLFDDQEGVLASLAAKHIGIPIEIQRGADYLPYGEWDSSGCSTPEPSHEPFRSLLTDQSSRVAQHARVAFTGDGGDGILTGQSWPYLLYLIRGVKLPTILRQFGGYFVRHGRVPPLRGGFRVGFRRWLKQADAFADYPKWLTPDFEKAAGLRGRWFDLRRSAPKSHPWYPEAHARLMSESWGNLMEGRDPVCFGAPIEVRAPFLDLRIVRFLLRVPPVPLCINKQLLRRAVGNLLPEKIRTRPKTPFQGDEIRLLVERHKWKPSALPHPLNGVDYFIDRTRLGVALNTEHLSFPWPNLRPVSLSYWLRDVEKNQSFQ